jgi:3-deoxy-manno-octulosonate cytidylyltransferase (CMP-KDO synthetase)
MEKVVCIIPARMGATRFPGKPLAPILGVPLVEHVRRRVALSECLAEVIVATCDDAIRRVVEEAGGRVVMTADTHERCTDRVAEAAAGLDAMILVNVQGDEPLVFPQMIEDVTAPLLKDPALPAANLVTPIMDEEEFDEPNAPKVVTNLAGDVLYISREPIPSRRKAGTAACRKLKQLGIIAFRSDFLQTFARLPQTPLERVESVDMLRAVEHGFRVRAVETRGLMIGVDVPRDIARVERVLADDPLFPLYRDSGRRRGEEAG